MSASGHEAAPPSTLKHFRAGTHRTIAPEQTLERVRPLLPVFGITRIANVTGLDCIGIPVVMVCRPNARSLSVSQGKGLDLASARASGVMESIELFHAERINMPLKLASVDELRFSHPLIDVEALPRLSVSSFRHDLRLLWVQGFELLGGSPVWLPFELVHMCYTLPLPTGSGSFLMGSRGLASGNHPMEAVSHAICELVEHDATTRWRLRGEEARRQMRLDLSTVDDAACRTVLQRYEDAGVDVAVWETTSEVGIASFLCEIEDREFNPARPLGVSGGMGCHPSRQVALLRALSEAAQSRLTNIAGSRDDMHRGAHLDLHAQELLQRQRASRQAELPTRRFGDAPSFESETFEADVTWELERLRGAGIGQVVVLELTRPEFRIPVVRVVIPGLEPLSDVPGYVPGARARRWLQEGGT
ncbi:MAG TPA: YcaO-like family protein [Myxococcaceae bacterium]|jgi:ribosomal protein S12 methylthiotransferase accessory factor